MGKNQYPHLVSENKYPNMDSLLNPLAIIAIIHILIYGIINCLAFWVNMIDFFYKATV